MKRAWIETELEEHWTLDSAEQELLRPVRTDKNRLGFALQLKFFQLESRFPKRKQDLPVIVLNHSPNKLRSAPAFLRTIHGKAVPGRDIGLRFVSI